jgi:hypothetical protein
MEVSQNLTGVPDKVRSPAGCQYKSPGQGQNSMNDLYTDTEREQLQEIKRLRKVIPGIRTTFVEAAFKFTLHFPHNFIEEAWKDDAWLQKHLRDKFTSLCRKDGYGSPNAVLNLYAQLDHQNRVIFIKYIVDWFNQKWPAK